MICTSQKDLPAQRDGHMLTRRELFFVAVEYLLYEPGCAYAKEVVHVRRKFIVASMAPEHVTPALEQQLSQKLVAPGDSLDLFSLTLYGDDPLLAEVIPPSSRTKKKKKKCAVKGGGEDDLSATPPSSVHSTGPFYRDLRPSSYIADWLLDFVNMGVAALYPRGGIKVIGADLIRNWFERDAAPEMRKALDARWADPVLLAPLLVRGDHWVLLRICRFKIEIFDSLRSHTGDAAHVFARKLVKRFPVLRDAQVESAKHWAQQERGSNDCALFVMRAVLHVLGLQSMLAVLQFFDRRSLDDLLPHIPGADPTSGKTNDFLRELYKVETKKSFAARLVAYLSAPKTFSVATSAPLTTQSKPRAPSAGPSGGSPAQSQCNSTPATAKPPPKEAAVAPPPQAPKPVPCPWPGCKSTVTLPHGRSCDGCGGRFCTRHRGKWAGAKWRCAKCVEAQSMSAPCGHHKCTLQGGIVKLMEALTCTECKKLFHKKHARRYDKATLEFHCGDCRTGYHKHRDDGSFSMPHDDLGKAAPQPGAGAAPAKLGFLTGQGSPLLAMTAGTFVSMLSQNMRKVLHPLADKGITEESRKEHQRLLLMVSLAPVEMHSWPIPRMVLEVLERERKRQSWRWVTIENKTGQMAAALSRLPQYTQGALAAVKLSHDQEWRDACCHIRRKARRTMRTGLPSVSEAEIVKMIETAKDPEVKAILILIWACAARSGDVSQLKTAGITLGPTVEKPQRGRRTNLSVFFERGKVIGKIDPYHIHTAIPEMWTEWLRDFVTERKASIYLFQMPSKAARERFLDRVREHVRTVAPRCDLRALRRGSAQNMAEKGLALTTIMQFTKHTDLPMLRRYLRFGKTVSEEVTRCQSAALKIWPLTC